MSHRSKFLLFSLLYCAQAGFGQPKAPKKISVFIDCNGVSCDENFIRSEIRIVDFLRDQSTADFHMLITARPAGTNVQKYQIISYGQNAWAKYKDTLSFSTKPNSTKDEDRKQLVHYLKLSLASVLAKTPFAESFTMDMKADTGKVAPLKRKDPWNYFVFSLGADGEYNADENYKSKRASGYLNLNRTTEKIRFGLGGYYSKYYSLYTYEDTSGTTEYEVKNGDYGISQFLIFSLGQRFSFGYLARYSNNTFSNFDTKLYAAAIMELNLFRYSDINHRSFLIRYGADRTEYNYIDTTIYNKKSEILWGHEASAVITFNQKWGSFSSGAYYRYYFHDPDLKSMGANVSFNIRIVGGLSFFASGLGNIVHDQVYLPKGNATEQQVLIRQRQLKSTYNFYTSGGISLRFGSKNNNFVNPRISGFRGF